MEEKKTTKKKAAAEAPQMNPEQLQAVFQQANERINQVVAQARQLEQMLRDRTIDQMFNVLKYAHEFTPDFVGKCADAITAYISNLAFTEDVENAEPEHPVLNSANEVEEEK